MKNEINIVHCAIYLNNPYENVFIKEGTLIKELNKIAIKYFKKSGIIYIIDKPSGLGGGGEIASIIEGLRSLFNIAWDHKGIIAGITFSINVVKFLYKYFKSKVSKIYVNNSPRITINLGLQINNKIEDSDYYQLRKDIVKRLIIIKSMNDDLCKIFNDDYPKNRFDQVINLRVYKLSFRVTYTITPETNNSFNDFRILRLLQSIKLRRNLYSTYIFTKWCLILRNDRNTIFENGFWSSDANSKNYFLFLSTKLFGE